MLIPGPYILANEPWARRVVEVAELLDVNLRSPLDTGPNQKDDATKESLRGMFQGSHVEVKLAVHGIMLLLRIFGIVKTGREKLTLEMLGKLKQAQWDDGSRPKFEVYFSRKYCVICKKLVRRLQRATGITIALLWKPRLTEVNQGLQFKQTLPSREHGHRHSYSASEAGNDEKSPFFVTQQNVATAQPTLQTVEENGIIYYLPTHPARFGTQRQPVRSHANISKPLPPTAQVEPPAWYTRDEDEEVVDYVATPQRSPRPYSMCLS